MNKKLNTIFFIIGATFFNVLTAIACFFLLSFIYIKLYNLIPEQSGAWIFAFIFIASIVVSFIAYRLLLKYLLKKIDVDKYFDPIFVKRNIRKSGS